MKALIMMLAVLFSLSTFAQDDLRVLRLNNNGSAEVTFTCLDNKCNKIKIENFNRINDSIDKKVLVESLRAFIFKNQFLWATPVWEEIKPDRSAGGLNLFLPVIWVFAGAVGGIHDAYELLRFNSLDKREIIHEMNGVFDEGEKEAKLDIGRSAMNNLNNWLEKNSFSKDERKKLPRRMYN